MTVSQGRGAWIKSLVPPAAADTDGLLDNGDFSKLAAITYGTTTIDLDIEAGTYDGNVNVGANREVRARTWSNSLDGEGRWFFRPIAGRVTGNVIIRLVTTIGVSGVSGNKIEWVWSGQSYGAGDTFDSSLQNVQSVYQDVSAQTAHVLTTFDITVSSALFDSSKRFAMKLKRLSASYAGSGTNYTAGTFYLHGIDVIFTGYGLVASPSAPA